MSFGIGWLCGLCVSLLFMSMDQWGPKLKKRLGWPRKASRMPQVVSGGLEASHRPQEATEAPRGNGEVGGRIFNGEMASLMREMAGTANARQYLTPEGRRQYEEAMMQARVDDVNRVMNTRYILPTTEIATGQWIDPMAYRPRTATEVSQLAIGQRYNQDAWRRGQMQNQPLTYANSQWRFQYNTQGLTENGPVPYPLGEWVRVDGTEPVMDEIVKEEELLPYDEEGV